MNNCTDIYSKASTAIAAAMKSVRGLLPFGLMSGPVIQGSAAELIPATIATSKRRKH